MTYQLINKGDFENSGSAALGEYSLLRVVVKRPRTHA